MKIYIDSDYKCHAENDGTMREVEADFFDGKCAEFVDGYRFVPPGESWTREDGAVFPGEMLSPWKSLSELSGYQTIYERMLNAQEDMRAALDAIYGGDTDE